MRNYFAYGSNMDPEQLSQRCPGAVLVGTAILPEHRVYVTRDGWASVRAERGGTVYGVVWQLTEQDLTSLDEYEDTAHELYRRATKHVKRLAQAESLDALVYVASADACGPPNPGYLEAVIAAARHHGLPEPYLEELGRWLPRAARRERPSG